MGRSANKVGAPDKPMDKAGRTRVLLRVCKYLFKDRFAMLAAFIMMLVSNLLALAGPKITGLIIDAIDAETGVDMDTVTKWCIVLVVFYLISAVLSYILAVLMAWISQRVSYTMRKEVFAHLTELPVGYFDTHQTGDIVSHISYDIDTVNASLSHDLLQICVSVVTVVG